LDPVIMQDCRVQMSIVVGQVPVKWNIDVNLATVREVLRETRPGDVVILPEGMLSGYDEDLTPLDAIDPDEVNRAVSQVGELVHQQQVHLFCGSLMPLDGKWYNAGLYFPAYGTHHVYRKINLAIHERGRLDPGQELPTIDIRHPGGTVAAGVQLCREIRFPEQWQYLAAAGAQLFVYLTNATNTREPHGVWRSHLISRAAENQRFLASANVAHPHQHCPSMVVSPRGEILAELPTGGTDVLRHVLDLDKPSDWYLGQRRQDVLSLMYHGSDLPGKQPE
jgi:predicted amidohydrolase